MGDKRLKEENPMKGNLEDSVFSATKLLLHERFERIYLGRKINEPPSIEELAKIYPVTLELGPAGGCNNFCDFCNNAGHFPNTRGQMPLQMYKDLLEEVTTYINPNKRTRGMIFSSSGEPTLNRNINEFLSYSNKRDVDTALITNGTSLRTREGLKESIVEYANWCRVSLNAGTNETRALIHGGGHKGFDPYDFDKVLVSLEDLSAMKRKYRSNVTLGAQIVVTKDNVDEIEIASRKVKQTGIDYFQIKPVVFHPMDNVPQLPIEFWKDVEKRSRAIKEELDDDNFKIWSKDNQFDGLMTPDLERSAYEQCLAMMFPIIESDGDLYYCSQTRGIEEYKLGSLKENSFAEIWESQRRLDVTKSIILDKCQRLCRNHNNNKTLTKLAETGINYEIRRELDRIKKSGGRSPNFT